MTHSLILFDLYYHDPGLGLGFGFGPLLGGSVTLAAASFDPDLTIYYSIIAYVRRPIKIDRESDMNTIQQYEGFFFLKKIPSRFNCVLQLGVFGKSIENAPPNFISISRRLR